MFLLGCAVLAFAVSRSNVYDVSFSQLSFQGLAKTEEKALAREVRALRAEIKELKMSLHVNQVIEAEGKNSHERPRQRSKSYHKSELL